MQTIRCRPDVDGSEGLCLTILSGFNAYEIGAIVQSVSQWRVFACKAQKAPFIS